MSFTPANPRTALVASSAAVDLLLEAHKAQKVHGDRQATGGIYPICFDPDTRQPYFLLGLNAAREYCHFHGWVDRGETLAQGAAREGWEESKGILGPMADLWRAVMLQDQGFSLPFIGTGFLVNFGFIGATERQRWSDGFFSLPHYFSCMNEVSRVDWIDACKLRDACLRSAADRGDSKHYLQEVGRCSEDGTLDYRVDGFVDGAILRPFLHTWFIDPKAGLAYFNDPFYRSLFAGDAKTLQRLRPLSELPPLQLVDRDRICKVLEIPVCQECQTEGHATGVCVATADKDARRKGTLRFFVNNETASIHAFVEAVPTGERFMVEYLYAMQWVEWAQKELSATSSSTPQLDDASRNVATAGGGLDWSQLSWPVRFQPRMRDLTRFFPREIELVERTGTPAPCGLPRTVRLAGHNYPVNLRDVLETRGKRTLIRSGDPGVCHKFLRGSCRHGAKCHLLHIAPTAPSSSK